jgi:hypothetical protein
VVEGVKSSFYRIKSAVGFTILKNPNLIQDISGDILPPEKSEFIIKTNSNLESNMGVGQVCKIG